MLMPWIQIDAIRMDLIVKTAKAHFQIACHKKIMHYGNQQKTHFT
jgi:hypothetical protein